MSRKVGELVLYAVGPTMWCAGRVEEVRGNRLLILTGCRADSTPITEWRHESNVKSREAEA